MKNNIYFLALLSFFLLTVSCGDDETMSDSPSDMGGGDDPTELTLEEEQEQTVNEVTNGSAKTWKITEAILKNSTGEINISENFNVKDDEFVFRLSNGVNTLTWNRNHDIPAEATSAQDALLDYYLSPLNFTLLFDPESASTFGSPQEEATFTKEAATFTGSLRLSDSSQLDVVLSEKTAGDYESAPLSGLTFNEVASFEAFSFAGQNNVGLTGSYSDNSLFIAHRQDCDGPGGLNARILKVDIDNATLTEEFSGFLDFFTRKLNIINNDLILTGGQRIYTYEDLDISQEPIAVPHDAGNLSRYSTVTSGEDIYVVGGDLDAVANKIRKINSVTGALDIVATLPAPKSHAGSEIINDQLYIFSGRQAFNDNASVTSESFKYNLATGDFQTFNMPVALSNSYASRHGNLIYIAGDIQEDIDLDGTIDNHDIWLGVYDTLTDQITEITHNLDDSDQFSYIQQLTVFNEKLYVIYGDTGTTDGDPDCPRSSYSVLEAAI